MYFKLMLLPIEKDVVDLVIRISLKNIDEKTEFSKELWRGDFKIRMIKVMLGSALAVTLPFYCVAQDNKRYSMTYLSYGSYEKQLEYVALAKGSFSVISPSYFNILEDGSLQVEKVSTSYVQKMHEQNVKIVPFLSNHWNRTAGNKALDQVEQLASQVASAVEAYNLDGVNVDIENVTHQYRESYTKLVQLLREKIPAHKEVSVAVAANPHGWNTGWHGSYDYKALGDVADHLFIMAYDEHFNGGDAGPVASINFVEKSIQYALRYVPKEKIVLGVPFFGRLWSEDQRVRGMGITNRQIESVLKKTGGTGFIDPISKSVVANFYVKETDSITVNGQKLNKGNYTVWYDNSDTLKHKLSLVDKYGLKGAGSWSVGQETPDVWDYFSLWLNGQYFSDIFSHFAKDDILYVEKKGWMIGIGEHEFYPDDGLTRAQTAVIIARVLNLPASNLNHSVTDISNHWANVQIASVLEKNIMVGYPDGTFRPNQAVTREEIAVILQRVLQYNERGVLKNRGFSDVTPDRWSYQEITALLEKGILNGYPDNTFRPEQYLSRGEMAHLLRKALN